MEYTDMEITSAIDEALRHYGGQAKRSQIIDYIAQKYQGINPASIGFALYHNSNQNPRTGFRYRRVRRGVYALNESDGA